TNFAAPLSVALPRERTIARTGSSEVACCQRQVGGSDAIINAFALMFQSACGVDQCRVCLPEQTCRRYNRFWTQATHPGDALRGILLDQRSSLFPPHCALTDECFIDHAFFDDHM